MRDVDSTPSFEASGAATLLAWTAMVILTAMVAISIATGVSQEQFEMVRPDYGPAITRAAPALRTIIALDSLFLISYAAFFVMFVRARGAALDPVVRLGLAAILATTVLDMIEDHHLIALATTATRGGAIDEATMRFQHVLSQVKFHLSYLGLVLLALGLPRPRPRDRVFAIALGVPLPVLGAVLWGVPSIEPVLDVARWLAFLGGFAGAIAILRR